MASTNPAGRLFFQNDPYDWAVMAGRPPTKDAPAFGQRLAEARKLRGLTQQQLGDAVGVTQKMIDYFERRAVNVKSDMVRKLAGALSVGVDELLGSEEPKQRRGRKSNLLAQFEQVSRLPKKDRELVSQLINRFLENANGTNGH
jgi:transcriptional regulator with XRE-family HTH domain